MQHPRNLICGAVVQVLLARAVAVLWHAGRWTWLQRGIEQPTVEHLLGYRSRIHARKDTGKVSSGPLPDGPPVHKCHIKRLACVA